MKFSTVLTFATVAFAAPTELDARDVEVVDLVARSRGKECHCPPPPMKEHDEDKGGKGTCNNNQKQVCCSGLIGSLLCIVGGDSCGGDTYCCDAGDNTAIVSYSKLVG